MNSNCPQCAAIRAFEEDLDRQAGLLLQRAKDFRRPMVELNNKRWRAFARLLSRPIIGRLIHRFRDRPFGIEYDHCLGTVPSIYDQPWYRDEHRRIRNEADKLEVLKAADMDHWGDEVVQPCNGNDPGGYYTPLSASRRECYAHGLKPFTPDKYDEFGTLAEAEELAGLVTDLSGRNFTAVPNPRWTFSTRQNFPTETGGVPAADNGIVPGHNQWLDPNSVQTVGSC